MLSGINVRRQPTHRTLVDQRAAGNFTETAGAGVISNNGNEVLYTEDGTPGANMDHRYTVPAGEVWISDGFAGLALTDQDVAVASFMRFMSTTNTKITVITESLDNSARTSQEEGTQHDFKGLYMLPGDFIRVFCSGAMDANSVFTEWANVWVLF